MGMRCPYVRAIEPRWTEPSGYLTLTLSRPAVGSRKNCIEEVGSSASRSCWSRTAWGPVYEASQAMKAGWMRSRRVSGSMGWGLAFEDEDDWSIDRLRDVGAGRLRPVHEEGESGEFVGQWAGFGNCRRGELEESPGCHIEGDEVYLVGGDLESQGGGGPGWGHEETS